MTSNGASANSHPPDVEWLVGQFQGPLLRFAARMLRDEDAAEDVVQEAFIRYLKSGETIKDPGLVSNWLFRVTRNLCVDYIRKESRMREAAEEISVMPAVERAEQPSALESLEHHERVRQVETMMTELTENQRAVVLLRFQEDKSYKEIAAITSLSVTNVGFLLHQAVKKLGRMAKQEGTA